MTSTPTQIAPATDIEAALNRFDEAAQTWGWEQDWGTGGQDTADCMAEYEASKADLRARIKAVREQTIKECAAIALDNLDQDISELILALLTNKGEQR